MSVLDEHVDVAIIGGGLVGSATAAAIASSPLARGLSIALIDPNPQSTTEIPPMSLRTSTITPASKEFLQDISVWQSLPVSRIAPFKDMLVWDSPAALHTPTVGSPAGALHFDSSMNNASELGYVVDNDALRFAIYSRLQQLQEQGPGRVTLVPRAIRDIDYGEGNEQSAESDSGKWPVIHMDDGQSVVARLVVACDGARSRVRALAGLDWFQKSYGQYAVVATVKCTETLTTAYQRFLSTGPLAVLPMASGGGEGEEVIPLANIVWTTTPTEAKGLNATDDSSFIRELNTALVDDEEDAKGSKERNANTRSSSGRADRVWAATQKALGMHGGHELEHVLPHFLSVHGSRGFFPLHCGHAPRYVHERKRTVLVGDAAHNIHPLAGQGVNLGFSDARSISDAIVSAAANGRDVGGENGAPLMHYQAERLPANIAMMGVLHSIQGVFNVNSSGAFRDMRRVGMSLLNSSGFAKRSILRVMR